MLKLRCSWPAMWQCCPIVLSSINVLPKTHDARSHWLYQAIMTSLCGPFVDCQDLRQQQLCPTWNNCIERHHQKYYSVVAVSRLVMYRTNVLMYRMMVLLVHLTKVRCKTCEVASSRCQLWGGGDIPTWISHHLSPAWSLVQAKILQEESVQWY